MKDWLAANLGLSPEVALLFSIILSLGLVLALAAVVIPLLKRFARTSYKGARNRQPRIAIMDAADIDARRRLLLIRRDNVEHLILVGGQNDLVVEQQIVRGMPVSATHGRSAAVGGHFSATNGYPDQTSIVSEPSSESSEPQVAKPAKQEAMPKQTAPVAIAPAPEKTVEVVKPVPAPAPVKAQVAMPPAPKPQAPQINVQPAAPQVKTAPVAPTRPAPIVQPAGPQQGAAVTHHTNLGEKPRAYPPVGSAPLKPLAQPAQAPIVKPAATAPSATAPSVATAPAAPSRVRAPIRREMTPPLAGPASRTSSVYPRPTAKQEKPAEKSESEAAPKANGAPAKAEQNEAPKATVKAEAPAKADKAPKVESEHEVDRKIDAAIDAIVATDKEAKAEKPKAEAVKSAAEAPQDKADKKAESKEEADKTAPAKKSKASSKNDEKQEAKKDDAAKVATSNTNKPLDDTKRTVEPFGDTMADLLSEIDGETRAH